MFATTVGAIRNIAVHPKIDVLDNLETQPFLKIYTLHEDPLDQLPHAIIHNNPMKKSIVATRKEKIMMGVYCDGENVQYWKSIMDDKDALLKHLNILYEREGIPKAHSVLAKYWEEGIHYFKPTSERIDRRETKREELLKKYYVHPTENIYLCGEMVSRNQGWVEGALESVERLMDVLQRESNID